MESNYTNQASALPHFSEHHRQRSSGIGGLASGIGRIALRLVWKFVIPAAKGVGNELLLQSIPELMDVVSYKKIAKASSEKLYIKHSQKANRRLIGAANDTKKNEL